MKVYVYPADPWACGHYRMIWPGQHAAGEIEVVVIEAGERSGFGGAVDNQGRLLKAIVPEDADVVVLQRPTHSLVSQAVPLVRAQGVAVVVDMDDDLSSIHPTNPAFTAMHPNYGDPDHNWHNATRACREATLVTVSTTQLADQYGQHGRVQVLHNYVPRQFLEVEHEDSELLTWCGSLHSHPNDLEPVGSAIASLVRQGYTYRTIGSGFGVSKALGLPDDCNLSTGTLEFDDWAANVARSGITIAPLADTKFNAAKSWLKPLEAMACGVPVVMSPRTEYHKLQVESQVGLLAAKPKHWERALRQLLQREDLRREQSEAGRTAVRERYTIEANAWQWAEAWTRAVRIERNLEKVTV